MEGYVMVWYGMAMYDMVWYGPPSHPCCDTPGGTKFHQNIGEGNGAEDKAKEQKEETGTYKIKTKKVGGNCILWVLFMEKEVEQDEEQKEEQEAELIKPASTASGAWGTFWMAGEHFGQ